jgi:hypothetical protein
VIIIAMLTTRTATTEKEVVEEAEMVVPHFRFH